MDSRDLDFVRPWFLGPAAENQELLESLVVEFLRDHACWRRNFHPEDGQRISARARLRPDFLEFQARMNRFGRRIFEHMRTDGDRPVQVKTFIGSHTALMKENLPGWEAERILGALGIDPDTFRPCPRIRASRTTASSSFVTP